jgi:hypothetical protein
METTLGCRLDEIEPFTQQLSEIVAEMQKQLVNETRILEGTAPPEYEKERIQLENELSRERLTEEQWKNALQNGFLITVPTLTSMPDSNNFLYTANLSDQSYHSEPSEGKSGESPENSCLEELVECGYGTAQWNVYSVSTDRMISELKPGTPNEEK